jgi:hypothetical protein
MPLEKTIVASQDGKVLFIKVNKKEVLFKPWKDSYFHAGDKVFVHIEKEDGQTKYVVEPFDRVLYHKIERNWQTTFGEKEQNGVSSAID